MTILCNSCRLGSLSLPPKDVAIEALHVALSLVWTLLVINSFLEVTTKIGMLFI